jgi:predicted thioesterase
MADADQIPLKDVEVGHVGSHSEVVTFEHTVGAHVAGMPPVYGTPMMIMAMEKAAGLAIAKGLPFGWITVGAEVDIRHLAPTPVGRTVTATARVLEVKGRSVLLAVEAHDGERKIGEGRHLRAAVELARFRERFGL